MKKSGIKFCDIGCDQGLVGIKLIQECDAKLVIFSDILRSPLCNAIANVKEYGIADDKVDFRVGDGLNTIDIAEIDTVIISGLGGKTIVDILANDIEKTRSFKRFVLQPTNGENLLRKWLCENCFVIQNESLIEENDVFYETFLVTHGEEILSEKEIKFGKYIDYNDKAFIRKYSELLKKLLEIIDEIPEQYDDKKAEFNKEIVEIKKVLKFEDR